MAAGMAGMTCRRCRCAACVARVVCHMHVLSCLVSKSLYPSDMYSGRTARDRNKNMAKQGAQNSKMPGRAYTLSGIRIGYVSRRLSQ